ncbi:MAG: hypothetical protein J6Y25_00305 [Elusimicrobiaceae bacterium]|nr:hypothetical protein [Elusimicrobiaceae bacterium]MBP5616823.1 hypothetical protein [Elusimicrobiaceae bacterium]
MKKILILVLLMGLAGPCLAAQDNVATANTQAQQTQNRASFKARRKLVKQLIKKYKKAPEAEKPAIKAQLAQIVDQQVDAQIAYMKNRIEQERANLDHWEAKIQADEANLAEVKARRVEDLLSGEAKKKQQAAKKAWKAQMRRVKK